MMNPRVNQPINISNVGGSSRPPELFSAFRRGLGLCTASPHRAGRGLATAHGAPCPLQDPLEQARGSAHGGDTVRA